MHIHPGNVRQKQALLALNLQQEQLARCISVNLYSVLRQYYQGSEQVESETSLASGKHKVESTDEANGTQPAKPISLVMMMTVMIQMGMVLRDSINS